MTLGAAIFAKLTADEAVKALVASRIFPGKAPQGAAAPRVVFLVVSDVPDNVLNAKVESLRREVRLQVDCYAKGYLEVQAVAKAIDDVLGNLASSGLSAWRENSTDLYDDVAQLDRVLMEFWVSRDGDLSA